VKTFRHDFFVKCFRSVFELPSLKNTQKRDIQKKSREKTDIDIFVEISGKDLDLDFLQKYLNGVF
jgi:hypothetical protein